MQQVHQKINSLQQMVSNIRQSEQNNQQRLQQIAQDEAYAAQQLQRIQQICQEVSSNLQNLSSMQFTGMTQTQGYASPSELAHFGTTPPTTFRTSPHPQGSSLYDPTTMGPSTYQGTMQTFGNMPYTAGQTGSMPQNIQTGATGSSVLPTSTSFSNISTMGPDTYLASREHLGKGSVNLSQVGQQAGISGYGTTATNMGAMTTGSQFANIATMGPDTYQSAQQQLGGMPSNLSQIGQQAGITSNPISRGYNQ